MQKNFKIFFTILLLFSGFSSKAQINTDKVLDSGRFALYQQEYVLAISFFNKIINTKPYLGVPYYFRARAKYSLDDLIGAEKDMDKALEISPFYGEFYRFRGDIRNKLGNNEGALQDYGEGLRIEPENISIFFNRGLVFMDMEKYDKAVGDFSSVLKLEPAQYGAYINRAIAKLNMKDTIGAVTDMDEAIEVNPLVAEAYRFSAAIYYDVNDFGKALSRINEAIKLDGQQTMYYALRGVIRYQLDDLEGTMADFNKVIEFEPKNVMAYANRGILRVEIGDINNAIDDFSRVLALNPNDLLTLYNRSLLYLRVGQYRNAISDLNLIVSHYPDYPDAYMARSQAFARLGLETESRKDMNMAIKLEQDQRKQAENINKTKKSGSNKPKETRSQSDEDINNHDKIAVLDDFSVDQGEVDEIKSLKGKIQNQNIIIDLEKFYSLTFFTNDSLNNRTPYFKPEINQFNNRKAFHKPLVFSNKEKVQEGENAMDYLANVDNVSEFLAINPNHADLRFIRAILYGVVLNYSSAIADYDYIIDNNLGEKTERFFYYLNRASVRFKMVQIMQSFDEEELPIKLTTKSVVSAQQQNTEKKDNVVKRMLDYDLVEQDLNKVLELKPDFEFAYYNLAILQCVRKDYKNALSNFTKAIQLNPLFAEAYFNRGLTRIFLKQDEQGTMDLSKAGELGMYKAYNVMKRYGMQKEEKQQEEEEKK